MSISTHTLLPSASFRHIGIMIFLMSILMGAAGFGFVSVNHIVKGWLSDTQDVLSIEIPAFDESTESILTNQEIQTHYESVLNILNHDPIIQNVGIFKPEDTNEIDLPAPIFLTLKLNPNRVKNAEDRIITTIEKSAPNTVIKQSKTWAQDITQMTLTLKTAFGALGFSVILVTVFMIIGVVKTQLKASANTISLIHLLGAHSATIQGIFQRAITRSVATGAVIGLGILAALISPLTIYLGIAGTLFTYWGILIGVFLTFIILTLFVTGLTVSSTLREMP